MLICIKVCHKMGKKPV